MPQWPGRDREGVYVPRSRAATPESDAELRARLASARVREGLPVSENVLSQLVGSGKAPGDVAIYTAAELKDIAGDSDRVERARRVLAEAADVLGGLQVCWVGGRRGVRVLLKAEEDRYRRLLSRQLGPDRVVIQTVPLNEHELLELRRHVRTQSDELAEQGIFLTRYGPRLDGFEIEYIAWHPDQAEGVLRERFGESVILRYRGATLHTFSPFPFGSWLADEDRLHVFYGLPRNGERFGGCQVREDERTVLVALTLLDWSGGKTLVGGFTPSHATVQLEAPLGDRVVIDDAENHARPHWTEAAADPVPVSAHHTPVPSG